MAESSSKTGIFAKAQKKISRTKTKVLQNLGKAEKTTDDLFNDYVQKTEKQQEVTHHLQKELKHYIHCVKDLSQAHKSLYTALSETYESEWTHEPLVKEQIQTFDLLWNDYLQNLNDNGLIPLQTHLQHFPILKVKVSKRGRKMVDYDNSRHHLEVLQAAKKRDEAKIQKAQEELKEAKKIYEEMNNELHTELPEFYNSRVTFYAGLFSGLFGAEALFHEAIGKSKSKLNEVAEELAKDYAQFTYTPRQPLAKSNSGENGFNGETSGASSPSTPVAGSPFGSSVSGSLKDPSHMYANQMTEDKESTKNKEQVNGTGDKEEERPSSNSLKRQSDSGSDQPSPRPPLGVKDGAVKDGKDYHSEDDGEDEDDSGEGKNKFDDETNDDGENNLYDEPKEPPTAASRTSGAAVASANHAPEISDDSDDSEEDEDNEESTYSTPSSNMPIKSPPPGFLYTVEATHKYTGEDIDELCFEPGELIYVIPFENPEEQDDGWQMGIKQSDGIKGVFPENFTQRT